MVMARWDPVREIRRMQETMDRLWRSLTTDEATDIGAWSIPMDVIETDDAVEVRATLPGVDPKDIEVTVEDNLLTISAERREETEKREGRYLMRESMMGMARRSIRLPSVIDSENAQSEFVNGVLTVKFPKLEQKRARRIAISAPGAQAQGQQAGQSEREAA